MPSLVAPFAGAWIEMASGTVAPSTADMSLPSRRSEEHTSELQSRENLVCRLLLEKKKKKKNRTRSYNKEGVTLL